VLYRGSKRLLNVGKLLPDYMAQESTRRFTFCHLHFSTLTLLTIRSSEKLLTTYNARWRHNPEDDGLKFRCREDLKSLETVRLLNDVTTLRPRTVEHSERRDIVMK
jgi:hypothetical protein